jgi:hypothetical protein
MARLPVSTCVVLLTAVNASAADIPIFNLEVTCRAAPSLQGGIQRPFQSCVEEEKAAHARLEKVWTAHTALQRSECVSLERIGGSPSYVDVLTCLEMYAADSTSRLTPARPR